MQWKQGEHVAIVGQTGSGKTYLESKLLARRAAVLVLRTKADDISFDGFRSIKSVAQVRVNQHRYILEPYYNRQRYELWRALELAWQEGCWCVAVDELFYAYERLKLGSEIERLLTQGRSLNVSVVCGMQRPARITRFALSEATHVFAFNLEGRDVKLLAEGTSPRVIEPLQRLKRYQFVYYNRVTRNVAVGDANHLEVL